MDKVVGESNLVRIVVGENCRGANCRGANCRGAIVVVRIVGCELSWCELHRSQVTRVWRVRPAFEHRNPLTREVSEKPAFGLKFCNISSKSINSDLIKWRNYFQELANLFESYPCTGLQFFSPAARARP